MGIEKLNVYSLAFKGVWGRKRKPALEIVEIGSVPEGQTLSVEDVTERARKALADLKVKPGGRWKVSYQPTTIERNEERGFTSRSFMLYSDTEVLSGVT